MKNLLNETTVNTDNNDICNINLPIEVWKPVKGYENYYEVSSLKNVRSVQRVITTIKGFPRSLPSIVLKRKSTSVTLSRYGIPISGNVNTLYDDAFTETI